MRGLGAGSGMIPVVKDPAHGSPNLGEVIEAQRLSGGFAQNTWLLSLPDAPKVVVKASELAPAGMFVAATGKDRPMDPGTIDAYDRVPERYVSDWESQPAPVDLHQLATDFFQPGPTADVGCGGGRDTAWLKDNGFDAVGFDPSAGLLGQARRRHPEVPFRQAALPELAGISENAFQNVLCETVIMHIAVEGIPAAVRRLLAILLPGGTLYLSWRVTEGTDFRVEDGRLYSAFAPALVTDALIGAVRLHDSESTSASSGRTVHRLVARKGAN
jgi:SAM-dependent methyltransferase